MAITTLPPAPSRQDPVNFANKADVWVAALDLFTTEANALQTDVNSKQTTASAAATTATTKASEASTSATNAATSATNAATSATNAANSATAAANSYDAFDDRYLGSKAADPTVDNDGAALLTGALYWNSTANEMRVWNGSSWQTASTVGGVITTLEVPDATFTIKDNTDATKKAQFELSGITTATTRTYTLPNVTAALATVGNLSQTFSGATTFSSTLTASGTTVSLGTSTAASTIGLGTGATISGSTKTINIGTAGVSGSTTTINFGSTLGSSYYVFNSTNAVNLPVGTTAQRPTGTTGDIRFNSSTIKFEGYNGSTWTSVGGGATGGGSDEIFIENGQVVNSNYTLTSNKNAMSTGPITVANGVTVTVPSGSRWVII